MIFLKNYFVNTTKDVDILPITHDVRYAIRDAGAEEGLVTVALPAPGAAIIVARPLEEVIAALKEFFGMFPGKGTEARTRRKESVAVGAWVRGAILGKSVSLPLAGGRPLMGLREDVLLVDFESTGRRREYAVQVMGEAGGAQPDAGQGITLGPMGEEEM